jgi:hypothetical protein
MSLKKFALITAALAILIHLGGCSGGKGSPADYPQDFKVVAADASAIATWTMEPDVEYWIFYGPGDSITTSNWVTSAGTVLAKVTSPRVVGNLVNGRTYSFTINGRKDGGPGGSGAPTQVAVPRLAGGTWTTGTPLGTGKLNGIAAGLTIAGVTNVVVGSGGAIYTTINSDTTTTPTNPAAPADLNAIFYSTVGMVAVGANGVVLYSYDGTTWVAESSNTGLALYGVASTTAGGYVAVGALGTIITSVDGQSWVAATSPTYNDLYAVTYGNGVYVAVGAKGTIVTSTDGVTWVLVGSNTGQDLRGVVSGFLDPDTLTPTTFYIAVGAQGTLLTSTDGQAWTARAPISTQNLAAVTYGGQFIAVGSGGSIYTSQDGVTWQTRTSGTASDLAAITRTLSGYTAVGDQGTNVSSF